MIEWFGLLWHSLVENKKDIPSSGMWFVCKIKSSDDLKLVYGFENVTAEHWDAWAEVKCPY